jgi:hypothetical protein
MMWLYATLSVVKCYNKKYQRFIIFDRLAEPAWLIPAA